MWKIGQLLPILVASSAAACRCSINRYQHQQPGRSWPSVWSAMVEVFRAQSWLNNLWTKTAGWGRKGRSWRNGRKGKGWEGRRGKKWSLISAYSRKCRSIWYFSKVPTVPYFHSVIYNSCWNRMTAVCKFRSRIVRTIQLIREMTQPKEYGRYELKLAPQQLRWVRGIYTHGVVEFRPPDYTTYRASAVSVNDCTSQECPRRPKKVIHCPSGGHWTTPTGPFTNYHAPNARAHPIMHEY